MRGTVRLLLATLIALGVPGGQAPDARAAGGKAATAREDDWLVRESFVQDLKSVLATVESVDITEARARVGGTLETLSVDEGSRVERGERIARVVDPKLPLQAASLDARIEALGARLREAQLQLARIRDLRRTGAASQSQLDEARAAWEVVTGELASARAERALVAERIREGDVLAPDGGRVLRTHAVAGTVILPGESVATIAVERYLLRLRLPERHARFMKAGDPVLVGPRGLAPEQKGLRRGRIVKVYPELEQGKVVADAEVEGLGDYFVGERARVWVKTGERPAILVPPRFIRTRSGVDYARVETPGGAQGVVVQLGRVRPTPESPDAPPLVEILSGLRAGDRLLPPAGTRPERQGR